MDFLALSQTLALEEGGNAVFVSDLLFSKRQALSMDGKSNEGSQCRRRGHICSCRQQISMQKSVS